MLISRLQLKVNQKIYYYNTVVKILEIIPEEVKDDYYDYFPIPTKKYTTEYNLLVELPNKEIQEIRYSNHNIKTLNNIKIL